MIPETFPKPREWPLWVWIVGTILASLARVDYALAGFSLATGVALMAGSTLGSRAGVRAQGAALAVVLPTALLLPWFGAPAGYGYAVGRVAVAALAGRLAREGEPARTGWAVRLPIGAIVITAVVGVAMWEGPLEGPQLKTYYVAVLGLALAIASYYSLKLLAVPARLLGFLASLAPYYLLGLAWTGLLMALPATRNLVAASPDSLVFHGLVAHLPGDLLLAVLAAFFTGAKRRPPGFLSR